MIASQLDKIRYQTRFVVHVSVRDMFKRMTSASMMLAVCWWVGATQIVLILITAIPLYELALYLLARNLPEQDDHISPSYIFCVWLVNWTSTIVYLTPAFILASEPSAAMLLAGFLWLFGVFVHISNTFASMPFFNWSLMIPSYGSAFYVFYRASGNAFLPSNEIEWIVTGSMMVVYIFNTFETMHKQKDTQRALNAAREEANSRLRALEYLSQHDSLTGLLNRRAFDEALAKLLVNRNRSGEVCVFLIDLDGFKPINDTYSHEAGDQVLQTIATRLKTFAGDNAIIGRLGGDEFVIATRTIGKATSALRFAENMAADLSKPVPYCEKELQVGASIGIGITSHAPKTVEALCGAADQAMYRAKNTAGINAVLFEKEKFKPRLTLDDRQTLIEAMHSSALRPFYQPKVDLISQRTVGFEALARWQHPTRGLVSPAEFLPMIEELGLHGDFLTHMATIVLDDVENMIAEGLDPGQVSLNVPEMALATHSGQKDLENLLAAHPSASAHLTLEITEDVFIARSAEIIRESIAHFRSNGLRISLDDFGTGFASFQHLRELEFDELKVDVSFVADLGLEPQVEVLISGFLAMAEGLGVNVIAEGVETEEQHAHLLRLGCKTAQGYLFGKAMPTSETRIRLLTEQCATQPMRRVEA